MSAITTHILDTARGVPARGVGVSLDMFQNGKWQNLASGNTNSDGRVGDLLPKDKALAAGLYRLSFAVGAYFTEHKTEAFFQDIPVVFKVSQGRQHYHVPLLLNPFGYSTYRGS